MSIDDQVDVNVTIELRGERVVVSFEVPLEDVDILENVLLPDTVDRLVSALKAT
jgi:hypothetical protein